MIASYSEQWQQFFVHPWLISLWVLLPCLAFLSIWSQYWRNKALKNWVLAPTLAFLAPRRWPGRLLLDFAVLCLVIAIARPQWSKSIDKPTLKGRDLFILVDVSRSMLAEDQPPRSRLLRAKLAIFDLLEHLQKKATGDRAGIFLFAGQAKLLCPLTEDLDHVRYTLSTAGPFSFRPGERIPADSTQLAGTSYLPVMKQLTQWIQETKVAKESLDVLLVSDGDDVAGDSTLTAQWANQQQLNLHTLAIGDKEKAWPIPWKESYLMEQSQEGQPRRVETKRNDLTLRHLAHSTSGQFLEEDADRGLVRWWKKQIDGLPSRTLEFAEREIPEQRPGWFLLAAFFLLMLELLFGGARRREW